MSPTRPTMLPRVHAVTNDEILADPAFLDRAAIVMRTLSDRGAVHLRGHRSSGARLHTLATSLLELQRETGCWLVINDRVDIALTTHAAGVQLTSTSLPVAEVRRLLPDARIGASVHSDVETMKAKQDGAEWVVAGNVYSTATHAGRVARGTAFLRSMGAAGIPAIAIGGVRPEDIQDLVDAGAYGVAMIRGMWGADNAEAAARRYLSIYDVLTGA